MQNELVQFLFQYLFASIGCFVIFIFGRFLLGFFPLNVFKENSKWFRSYCTMTIGLVIVILIYSIILTKGMTINILLIPILLGIFFSRKKMPASNHEFFFLESWPILYLITTPLVFVIIFHLFPEPEYNQMDALFYLQVSHSLNKFGQENGVGAMVMFGKPYIGTGLYHYFEFWVNALLIKCFGNILPGIQVLRFICYPIISTAGLMGLFALAQKTIKSQPSFWQKIFCFSFIFYLPDLLMHLKFLQPILIYGVENNMIERPNLRILYLFIPGLIIMIDENKYKWQTLFWLIGVMLASALFLTTFMPAALLFFIFSIKWLKNTDKKYAVFVMSGAIIISILYFIFYRVTVIHLNGNPISDISKNIFNYFLRYWKIILYATASSICYCLLFPFLLLAYLYKTRKEALMTFLKESRLIIIFSCIVISCSIGIARFLNLVDNAYQLAFVGYSLGAILLLILLLYAFKLFNIEPLGYLFICSVFILSNLIHRLFLDKKSYGNIFVQNGYSHYAGKKFSNLYIAQISRVFAANAEILGAYWADSIFYDSIPYYSNRNPSSYTLPSGYLLAGKFKYNYEVCLSDSASIMYGIDTTQKVVYNYLRYSIMKSPFKQNTSININEQRLSFIKKYKLQYLILTKNADTCIINKLPILQHFQDSNTGERFYLVDVNRL